MNYGFVPLSEADKKRLMPANSAIEREPKLEHTNIRLYEYVLTQCPWYPSQLAGKRYFEISCGHLGGLEWMTRAHPELASVKGVILHWSMDHQWCDCSCLSHFAVKCLCLQVLTVSQVTRTTHKY
jgi:hypothetical protein